MNILVTGSSGFLGKKICEILNYDHTKIYYCKFVDSYFKTILKPYKWGIVSKSEYF